MLLSSMHKQEDIRAQRSISDSGLIIADLGGNSWRRVHLCTVLTPSKGAGLFQEVVREARVHRAALGEVAYFHFDTHGILVVSQRAAYLAAISLTSLITPSLSFVGSRPRPRKLSLTTFSSFSAASLRGFSR